MQKKPPQNKYSVKLKRGSSALVGLSTREKFSKEELEQHMELAKRPLRKNATKGKSPIEAGLIVLRHITYRAGSNSVPMGHSTLDKLQSLRTDPAMELLKNHTWSDFFQQRTTSKNPSVRPSSANSIRSATSTTRSNNTSPIRAGTGSRSGTETVNNGGGGRSRTSPLHIFTSSSGFNATNDNESVLEVNSLTDDNIGQENMCRLFDQMVYRAERLWKQLHIPSRDQKFFRQTLLKYPPSCIDHCNELGKYIDCLNAFKQTTVLVVRSIEQRELVLTSVMDFLQTLLRGMERNGNKGDSARVISDFWKDEFISLIISLRNRTIITVKYIQQWRQSLWRPQAFFYENENYMLKIKSDLNILKSSKYRHFFDELNIGFQDLLCIIWPNSGIAYDGKGNEGLTSSEEVKRDLMQSIPSSDNDNNKSSKDSKYAKRLRGCSENGEIDNSAAVNKWIVAAKVVSDESTLQNALASERDVLKSQGVFIPFLKM